MKPSLIIRQNKDLVRRTAGRYSVANIRIFGSTAEHNDREGSDLDLLVDALPGTTLFDLGGLQADLEDALGIRVDLVTPQDLPPKVRRKVVAEARPI
jgi:predicted nucleotidyltransferase